MVVEKINLDLSLKMLPATVKAKQGDRESRCIEVSLLYNNLSYNVPATATVLISYLKPDKKKVENTVSKDNVIGNRVTFPLTEQMLTVAGISKCDVKIINDSGIISTATFQVHVEPQAVPDGEVKSTDEYNALIDALVEVRDAEDIRVSNEVDRVDNEVIREGSEDARRLLHQQLLTLQINLETLKTTLKETNDAVILNESNRQENEIARQQLIEELNDLIKQAESLRKEQFETNESSRESQFTTNETSRANQFNNIISEYEDVVEGVKNEEINRQEQFEANEASRKEKFDQMVDDGVYSTNIEKKLDTLEENYAPKLQGIEAQFNDAIANLTQDSEVIIARTSLTTGKSHESLPTRLDYMESEQINNDKPFHFNHAAQEYLNVDKFFESMKNGKIYTSEFNQHIVSPLPQGTKLDDNAGLIMEPSTNTVAGRDDYSKIGLFMPIDVNAYVDENDDYHVIAIKGDGRFKNDGTMGDVYVMNMVGYQKYIENDDIQRISYSDTMHPGFEVIDEAVKPDGTIRPYLLHAKYAAGRNKHENNNLASISGVYPEYSGMSHNGQIDKFKEKGAQYSGKTSHDDYYAQLIMWLKYATISSDTVMRGCQTYYLQYENLVAETGVKRVIITNTQANNLLVGSTVSIGDYEGGTKNDDRQASSNYSKANKINILSIENLGDGNSAVYVDSVDNFDTTLTTTITTYPWNSGGCDDVLGVDGSPYNAQSGKEPIIINGIETMVGGRELLQNLIIHNNNIDNRTDVYANYDCKTYATSLTENYKLVGQIATTDNAWKYGSKMKISKNHPSVILITETNASSTTGVGDAIYTNPTSHGGTREWLSRGSLSNGAASGLRCLSAYYGLSSSDWTVLGRLSATGRSRRRAGVN